MLYIGIDLGTSAVKLLLMDGEHRRWSQEMLDICGITEAQMPRLYESYEKVGTLKPEIAKQLVRIAETISPDPDLAARYEAHYRQFKQIYPAMKHLFPILKP